MWSIRVAIGCRAFVNQAAHYEIGQWLSQATASNTTVALMDVGLIGFVTQRPILNTFGLVNREIAALMHADGGWVSTSHPTAERIAEYTLANQPEIVSLSQNSGPDVPFSSKWSHDSAIYHNPQFQAEYELLFVSSITPPISSVSMHARSYRLRL